MFFSTPITDKSLLNLGKLKELHELHLDKTKVTDKGLKSLAKMRLTALSLRHTEISDAGLQELKGIATLRHLYLEGTNVTDGGIQVLSGLRDLRTLGGMARSNASCVSKALCVNPRFSRLAGVYT
jgi:internalin A